MDTTYTRAHCRERIAKTEHANQRIKEIRRELVRMAEELRTMQTANMYGTTPARVVLCEGAIEEAIYRIVSEED